jgi:hypothetical protein
MEMRQTLWRVVLLLSSALVIVFVRHRVDGCKRETEKNLFNPTSHVVSHASHMAPGHRGALVCDPRCTTASRATCCGPEHTAVLARTLISDLRLYGALRQPNGQRQSITVRQGNYRTLCQLPCITMVNFVFHTNHFILLSTNTQLIDQPKTLLYLQLDIVMATGTGNITVEQRHLPRHL